MIYLGDYPDELYSLEGQSMNRANTGKFITQMRNELGLSTLELAARIGVSQEMLEAYEDGTAKFRSEVIIKLGQEFRCGALAVMKGKYPPDKPHILRR